MALYLLDQSEKVVLGRGALGSLVIIYTHGRPQINKTLLLSLSRDINHQLLLWDGDSPINHNLVSELPNFL